MESNQVQVIRQDLRNFSGAVQNMVTRGQSSIYFMGRSELPNVVYGRFKGSPQSQSVCWIVATVQHRRRNGSLRYPKNNTEK